MSLIKECALLYFEQLNQKEDLSFLSENEKKSLLRVLGLSDFIAAALIKQPNLLKIILSEGLLTKDHRTMGIQKELTTQLKTVTDETSLQQVLRLFRYKHMVVIAWRDLLGDATLAEIFTHLSFLAEKLIEQAQNWLYQKQCSEQGTPVNAQGVVQPFYIFAMGKLGGRELNFSSDIDLIFTFPEKGETIGKKRTIDNQRFFTKLGQRLISALHQITIDGFVYRVDMRLRPFGDSGPLVSNFSALEDYYQSHGREWERYAMVKARVLGDDGPYKTELIQMLRPFVYRRYIDFSVIDSLRKMKALINAEERRKGLINNIKLGQGGIREIEFIAQSFQLIRGGKDIKLQVRSLLKALKALIVIDALPRKRSKFLSDTYCFLRKVENVLQEIGDKQTQTLPENDLDQQRLIEVMKFKTWALFYKHLNKKMQSVHNEFNWVVGEYDPSQTQANNQTQEAFKDLWLIDLSENEISALLEKNEIKKDIAQQCSGQILLMIKTLKNQPMGERGAETLDKLAPKIIYKSLYYDDPATLLLRIGHVLKKIITRTPYLELLNENDEALNNLLKLCNASEHVSDQLALHPILLDELLDPKQLYNPIATDACKRELQQFILRVPKDDMEQQMEVLRQFKQMQILRITASDIVGSIDITKVSDYLTELSEAIMDYVVQISWSQMVEKFGLPSNVIGTDRKGFVVIAYGKMGGFELGYGSDLDVIFLHDNNINGNTSGTKSIHNESFYIRLVQRIIHLFTARTNSGILYEIDMRLRPSGNSGRITISIDGFCKYLTKNAWTWEHQALVRARAVYFDELTLADFKDVREKILMTVRDNRQLKKDIREMRIKMRTHLNNTKHNEFDLKHSRGGLVDIEFIAQYLVLANADKVGHSLCQWSDNLRIFQSCKNAQLISKKEEKTLVNAYCMLRDTTHRLTLNKKSCIVKKPVVPIDPLPVIAIWNKFLK